jgi:hypothetical protein
VPAAKDESPPTDDLQADARQTFLQRIHQPARRSSGKRPSHRAWTWRAGRISCQ